MTKAQAYRILEVDQYTGQEEIKKKYRKLMHRVHPDANMEKESMYLYTAQEINEAYALLRNQSKVQRTNRQKKQASNSRISMICKNSDCVTVHAYVPSNGICRGFAFKYGKFLLPPRFLTALSVPKVPTRER